MQVDVLFDFAKVYNVDKKIDVVKGQKFTLNTDLTGESNWFSNNDQVLDIAVAGKNADVTAANLGTSTILIMGTDFGIQKELTITVVDEVLGNAVTLNASAGNPELK